MKRSPWHLSPDDLFRTLRGAGGQPFTDFVDALIRAEAAQAGISPDDIVTNIRTNIGDGGVDTSAKVALAGALQLEAPSAWQYKATDYKDVTEGALEEEMRKPVAAARIAEGHVYCLCVCDDAPAEWKEARKAKMLEVAKTLNIACPTPRLLGAGELADWASRFPAVVLRFFRPQLEHCLPHEAWLRKERADLPKYVEVPSRKAMAERLREHVDFRRSARGILTVAGAIGIGKSRFVAESLLLAAPLVLYVGDPDAAPSVATYLVNNPSATAVLVVDGCSTSARFALAKLLRGTEARVRTIIINDSSEEVADVAFSLEALDDPEVQQVLDANFSDVIPSHRRAFAHLADGVLQIAALLGAAYRADRHRFMEDASASALDVIQHVVGDDDDRAVLQAVSLFTRLGYKGDVSRQLDGVCDRLGLSPDDVVNRFRRLGRTPGVVSLGPRYLSVRPRLFVRPLLDAAWTRWVAHDVDRFLGDLPEVLRVRLVKQVAAHGVETQREGLVDWALPWLDGLSSKDLRTASCVELLLALVEVSPARIAPRLADLVVGATDEELHGGEDMSHWSTWMHVRWALRDLLGSRTTHEHAERALYRMALAEGDAASAVRQEATAAGAWATSFRIYLSGTEVPFAARLRRLSERLDEAGDASTTLVVGALNYILASHASRSEGQPLVAGEVRPQEWHPRTYGEFDDCLRGAIRLLERCLASPSGRAPAAAVLMRHGRGLLRNGMVDALRSAIESTPHDEHTRVGALGFVRDFLQYDCKSGENEEGYPEEYVARVETWRADLERHDLGGRLAEIVGATHWFEDESPSSHELQQIATELHAERPELEARLPWLVTCEGNGRALIELGRTIGKLDVAGELLATVFLAAEKATNPLFLRGFVLGLAEHTALDAMVAMRIDELERAQPALAVDLNRMIPRVSSSERRALRLVGEGRLGVELLRHYLVPLKPEFVADALETVLAVLADRREDSAAVGLDIVSMLAWGEPGELPKDPRSTELLWKLLDVALAGARGEAHVWGRVVRQLADRDFARAVEVCCRAVMEGDFSIEEEASKELTTFIKRDSEHCLSTLGPLILAAEAWVFSVGRRKHVLNAFPAELMKGWIQEHGVAAARVVAPCLPLPRAGADGSLSLHPLTEFVLERFEADDDVYSGFAHGRHNGQVYSGDIAGQHEEEAARAKPFLSHRLPRIRQWAEEEIKSSKQSARWWRERHEEDFEH